MISSTTPFITVAADLLRGSSPKNSLIRTSMKEIHKAFDDRDISVTVHKFSKLENSQSLQMHVQQLVSTDMSSIQGPASESSMVYKSPHHGRPEFKKMSLEEAAKHAAVGYQRVATLKREWQAMLKALCAGNYTPLVCRGVHFGSAGKYASRGTSFTHWPLMIEEEDGVWWGMLIQAVFMTDDYRLQWSLRDILTTKHSSAYISVASCETGHILWQNAASMELYGFHGQMLQLGSEALTDADGPQFDFVEMMFGPDGPDTIRSEMTSIASKGGTFRCTVEVLHPALRSLMCLRFDQEMHLDCQVSQTCDPDSLQKVFIVSQIDVTETVVSQQELQKARERLEAEKVKMDALLHRQKELIDCLGWVSEVGASARGNAQASLLIDSVRKQLSKAGTLKSDGEQGSSSTASSLLDDSINVQELVGRGSFGSVYKGIWRGLTVAVKSMTLPVQMSGNDKKQRMALMEAAISSSLSHPNIIKTHTYSIKPIREPRSKPTSSVDAPSAVDRATPSKSSGAVIKSEIDGAISAFEVKIVLEYCDKGTLRDALNAGLFHPNWTPNYQSILEVALDIARGMQHLHSCNIIHADLKASNILLQSSSEPWGVVAKIADFGLSISKVDAAQTHVSDMYQGTVTHMSPECLTTGQQSNAGDVYSFGITLFELYTATQAFKNIPLTFLGHMISQDHLRPFFPSGTPSGYKALAEACWDPSPAARPTFNEVICILMRLTQGDGKDDIDVSINHDAHPAVDLMALSEKDVVSQPFVSSDSCGANVPWRQEGMLVFSPLNTAGSCMGYAAVANREIPPHDHAANDKTKVASMVMEGIILTTVDESVIGGGG